MNKTFLQFLLVTLFSFSTMAQESKHVILLSIDGFRPEFYNDPSWNAVNLQALVKTGTSADHMLSVFPSYTYPTHTAMVTGAFPARSGIYYNQPVGSKGDWHWFTSAIKVPTLWQVLKKSNLTTSAVEWPVSVDKDITYNIPEIWSDAYPDRITEPRKYATPGLIEEIELNATGKLDKFNMDEEAFSMDDNSARMAAYIFKTKKPAFLAVHFAQADGQQHEHGRDADSVKLAVAGVDHNIGVIMEAVRRSGMAENTTIIIVGDHGFSTIHTVFRPNMLIKTLPAKFIAAGGSCFLYRSAGTSKANDASTVKAVTDSLNKLPKDKRKLFRIIDRKELDKMGADSSAILALAAIPGTVFSGSLAPAKVTNHGPGTLIQNNPLEGVFFPTTGGHHGYDPNIKEMHTGFIASGAGVNKGKMINEIRAVDIAPLIARLLGIEFNTPDGKLVPGIITNKKL
ncbi:Predicted pyrophosphatase or phosphodiesterase, AlkP superfamily [Mucilaginibacter pineti]|uniref:Predicted pyrophosphatase or phosphodiesterase, AlkP superfamily n=1 Tax=Mucilaginibacter pineti TaxID=1391627 RepID=A0A1G7EQV6_9SPHI|nr:ectonucleotide pyrophosphatase/phosphodiesterase [Mucilaginibacter pineti]SDE66051.1 Predicted pyrophosphatase or phosphodiesterase, AlkP superfamily [Mucilaginibacter pineti]